MSDIQTITLTAVDDATIELLVNGTVVSTVTLDMETSMLDASAVVDIVNQYVLAMQSKVEGEIPTELSQLINDVGFITEDGDTTYTLTKSGNDLVLTGSDGSEYSVTLSAASPSETYYQSGSDGWRFAYAFDNGDVWWSPYYQSGRRLQGASLTKGAAFDLNDRLTFATMQNEMAGNPINITLPTYAFSLNRTTKQLGITKIYADGIYSSSVNLSPIIPTELPNPNTLTINGTSYDGSEAVEMTIQGGTGTVDDALSTTSENPVQNKVITSALGNKADSSAIPTKVSDLTNDSGFITNYTETDPVFNASAAAGITSSDITNWNGKTSNVGTITGVSANGTSIATSGVANIPSATTSRYGVTELSDATNSTSTSLAATANAVRKAYNNGGVQSVNGATGAVTVTVPTKTSDLTNDSGFITDAGVTSFNGNTGAVVYTPPVTSLNLNGSSTATPSFYAPTTAGTSGYVLKSNGSGAPTWAAESGGGSNVTVTQTLTSGTEIASISVDNVPTKIYAPPDTLSAIAPERIDNTSGITDVAVSGITANTSPVVLRSGYTCTLDCEYTLTAALSSETTVATGLPPRIAGGIIDVMQQSTSYARPLRAIVNANGDLKLRYGEAGKYWIHMPYISSVPNSLIADADNTSY